MTAKANQYATQEQIAIVIKESFDAIPSLERKEGLPRVGKNKYDLVRVVHWALDRKQRALDAQKAGRNERTLGDVAFMFKREPRWINRLSKERGLPKDARGVYDIVKVIQWFVDDYEKQLKDARHGVETEGQARKRLYTVNADLKEMELATKRRLLINLDDLKPVLATILKAFADKSLTLSKRASPQVVALASIGEVEELLNQNIHENLDTLREIPNTLDGLAVLAEKSLAGGVSSIETAAEADRQRMVRPRTRPVKRIKR